MRKNITDILFLTTANLSPSWAQTMKRNNVKKTIKGKNICLINSNVPSSTEHYWPLESWLIHCKLCWFPLTTKWNRNFLHKPWGVTTGMQLHDQSCLTLALHQTSNSLSKEIIKKLVLGEALTVLLMFIRLKK